MSPTVTEDDVRLARTRLAMQTAVGLDVQWADPSEVSRLNPTIADSAHLGATYRDGDGFIDEGMRKDFSWAFTPAIVEWKHGDLGQELVEVSHEQAEKIIGYFRERWGPFGQPLDS